MTGSGTLGAPKQLDRSKTMEGDSLLCIVRGDSMDRKEL